MINRAVKSVTIEYLDGEVESFQEEGMYHVSRTEHPRGAKNIDTAFTTHQLRWSNPGAAK